MSTITELTSTERFLRALRGEPVDRTPWVPFLAYWWEHQSDALTARGEAEFLREIGADTVIRGHFPMYGREGAPAHLFRSELENCTVREAVRGGERRVTYETPVGALHLTYRYSETEESWHLVEHPLREPEDYRTLIYIKEHTRLEPDLTLWEAHRGSHPDVLVLPLFSPESKTAFQGLIEHWAGTEALIYMLEDEPELVEETVEAIRRVNLRSAELSLLSDAPVFLSFEDSSTTNYSPELYRRFILPELNEWSELCHTRGRLFVQHACGHLKALLPLIADSRIDCLESVSPHPTGNIELVEAVDALPGHIAIWGGIEPTLFLQLPADELEEHVGQILKVMEGRRFVLANSDSCPPGVEEEKFHRISALVRRAGQGGGMN